MNMTERINRQVAREHLHEVLMGALPSLDDREPAVEALLGAATVKIQQRSSKLVLTFTVDEDDADSNDQEDNA
jgi:hypothetical protein